MREDILDFIALPVTALACSKNVIFIGMGNCLIIRDLDLNFKNYSRHFSYPITGITLIDNGAYIWSKNTFLNITYDGNYNIKVRDRVDYKYTILNISCGGNILFRQNAYQVAKNDVKMCKSSKLLYSGIQLHINSRILIAAGTINNSIDIWKADSGEIIGSAVGHRGSIFCLKYNTETYELYSGSDDRSLRIWCLKDILEGRNDKCVTLWGHNGRVWSIEIMKDYILSGGEDGIFIWSINEHRKVKYIPTYSSVWNMAISRNYLYAGMENGQLSVINIEAEVKSNISQQLKDVIFNSKVKFQRVFHLYEGLKNCLILLGENAGILHMYRYDIMLNTASIVSVGDEPIQVGQYYLTAREPSHKHVLVNDINNKQFYFLTVTETELFNVEITGRLQSIVYFNRLDTKYQWLISYETETDFGLIGLLSFELGKKMVEFDPVILKLPFSKNRWLTYALKTETFTVLGTKSGHIVYYDDNHQVTSLTSVHGKHGVTDIQINEDNIHTCGRNGKIAIWNKSSLLAGSPSNMIRACLEWPINISNGKVYGFHASKFKCYNQIGKYYQFESECGGGHRSCDYWNEDDHFYLAFIKKGNLLIEFNNMLERKYTGGSGHCQHINYALLAAGKLVTCSDDTKIIKHTPIVKEIMDYHNTSMRCLYFEDKRNILVSGGGKGTIAFHLIIEDSFEFITSYVTREKVVKPASALDLMVADSRVMFITQHAGHYFALSSDGLCHILALHKKVNRVDLLNKEVISENHCPTKMISYQDFLLIIDTGGNLTVYSYDSPHLAIVCLKQIDDSGLNAIYAVGSSVYVGGDSGIIFKLEIKNSEIIKINSFSISTCCITDILFHKDYIITLAIDQRILLFDENLQFKKGHLTFVADPSLFLLHNEDIIVVGDGIEKIELEQYIITIFMF